MTSARKRRGKVIVAQTEHNVGISSDGVMRSTKRTLGRCHKATGKILHPLAKIKLQLFPIDEKTRMGLEKDGFHPYLELTLSTRKKISSVLKHLKSKWGSSSIALGEPMFFPYNTLENLASYRWTMNDNDISAGDFYAAIGNPTVFRLRYGWSSNLKTETGGVPSSTTSLEGCLKAQGLQRSCSTNVENTNGIVKQIDATRGELKPFIESGSTNTGLAEKTSFDRPVGSRDNEVRTDGSIGQPSLLWDDMLTNISIGGLLSEASLQGKFNSAMKSNGSNADSQPSQLISDSFDAFLAAQMNHPQGPQPAPQQPRSSILDAEDTCHAFAFQKFSSSGKDTLGLGGNISCSQGAEAEKFKEDESFGKNFLLHRILWIQLYWRTSNQGFNRAILVKNPRQTCCFFHVCLTMKAALGCQTSNGPTLWEHLISAYHPLEVDLLISSLLIRNNLLQTKRFLLKIQT